MIKRTYFVLIAGGLAVAAAYAYVAHPAAGKMPTRAAQAPPSVIDPAPAASSPATSLPNTQAVIGSGSTQAAFVRKTEVFASANHCLNLGTSRDVMQRKLDSCQTAEAGAVQVQCNELTKNFPTQIAILSADAAAANCATDPDALLRDSRTATAEAAKAGNVDAQMCYVGASVAMTDPSDIQAYKTDSVVYISQGLARGDWRTVAILATPGQSIIDGHSALGSLSMFGKPFTMYRATRLLQLGADGTYASRLALEARAYAIGLAPAQIANATQWAQQEYRQHFSASPRLTGDPSICNQGR